MPALNFSLFTNTMLDNYEILKIKKYNVLLIWTWSVISLLSIVFSVYLNLRQAKQTLVKIAETNISKDLNLRRWAASHGGVYVPVDSATQPNTNLKHIEERDIKTPLGKDLTLMNPAYMLRQYYEQFNNQENINRIFSNRPIRAENKADAWEMNALNQVKNGKSIVYNIEKENDTYYFRYMVPFRIEKSCLKCHATEGYKLNDLRGGIDTKLQLQEFMNDLFIENLYYVFFIVLLWLLGMVGIWYASRKLKNLFQFLTQKQKELIVQNDQYSTLNQEYYQTIQEIKESHAKIEEMNEELHENQDKLIEAKIRAEESDKLKSIFLANLSHEIRTPLNAILGFSGLLTNQTLSDDKRLHYIKHVNNGSDDLLRIISDIMDISKLETRQLSIKLSETDLNSILADVKDFALNTCDKLDRHNLEIVLKNKVEQQKLKILTDHVRLRQILQYLVHNSVKFTSEGNISILSEVRDNKELIFEVADTGIGIEEQNFERIFEVFRQVEEGHTRKYGGVGLGLSISKALVSLLGGKIWVKSDIGSGTSFFISIPYQPLKSSIPILAQTDIDWNHKTILVVEDDYSNSELFKEILAPTRANIFHTNLGLEAIEIFKKNPSINLILMDIQLPDINGFEATKIIKNINPNVIIIAQTAYALSDDRYKSIDSGCDNYIAKPIPKEELLELIEFYLS